LRALYAYFADRPLKEVPHIEVKFAVSYFTYALAFYGSIRKLGVFW
jgi:hypothetical protein